MTKSQETQDHYTEILLHRIRFFYRNEGGPTELPESEAEHIENSIKNGIREGELCYYDSENDTEYRGWWAIEK